MSAIKFELEAAVRADVGKGASRRLRHTNNVPAIVYGAGKPAQSLTLNHDKVKVALSHEAFYSHILNLKIDGKGEQVILKDVQRDPCQPRVAHIDFLRVRADQELRMSVPLHFVGEDKAPALKEGGVFSHVISDVEISCLPANLPEFIEVDVSEMVLNQTLHLSDIKLPKGVKLVAFAHGVEEHDHPVVSIHIPRVEEEVVEVAAEEGAPAEGAEGEVKAEGGEQAADAAGEKPKAEK
jgi:large subunit ribosomal protein L25